MVNIGQIMILQSLLQNLSLASYKSHNKSLNPTRNLRSNFGTYLFSAG